MKKILPLIILSVSFFSCQKVIDINLNDSDPKTVIEAKLHEGENDFVVKISETINYFEPEQIPAIKDAKVTLTDASGNATILTNNNDGTYTAENYNAVANQSYSLKVELANGVVHTASSFMPKVIQVLDVLFIYEEATAFGAEGFVPYCVFQDPANEENFYRLILSVNGIAKDGLNDMFLFDDKLVAGNLITIPLFSERLSLNDTVTMELVSMDKKTYIYLTTLQQTLNSGNSAAPANPNTNLTGDVLGYFGAFSSSSQTKIIE
jgi:hypothetical protein